MKSTEIITPHNVAVEYPLATLMLRFIAFFIDSIVIIIWFIICALFTGIINDSSGLTLYILWMPVFFLYHLLFELLFNGQSVGKMLLKIKVMKIEGLAPEFGDYFIRWAFRPVDILLSAGTLAAIFIGTTPQNQRLGDILAGTVVVRTRAGNYLKLTDILSIRDRNDYEPIYPNLSMFEDEDMLLVRRCLNRYRRHPGKASMDAVRDLAEKLAALLGVKPGDQPDAFLNQVLKDYIILSRS